MPEPLQTITLTNPIPSANDLLALQITQALWEADLIVDSDQASVFKMLTVGNVKAGDWLRILQINSTPTKEDYATTNHSA